MTVHLDGEYRNKRKSVSLIVHCDLVSTAVVVEYKSLYNLGFYLKENALHILEKMNVPHCILILIISTFSANKSPS